MNVIISNKYSDMLESLDIDIIKSMKGQFDVDELINTFSKFFFQRMILDITAIKNYENLDTLKRLSSRLDTSKIILLLDDVPESTSKRYLSKLISMNIYNFTTNNNGIKYLLKNPNDYADVSHLQDFDANEDSKAIAEIENAGTKVIGFRNVTQHSGVTTLVYLLYKQLKYNYKVACIQLDKSDFAFFNEKDLYSVRSDKFADALRLHKDKEVILVDLGKSSDQGLCYDIINLIEPSPLKLNKIMKVNPMIFKSLKGKKVILNQSVLSKRDVEIFQDETQNSIFFNIPPLNERKDDHLVLNIFLNKLGFIRQEVDEEEEKKSIFGFFNDKI